MSATAARMLLRTPLTCDGRDGGRGGGCLNIDRKSLSSRHIEGSHAVATHGVTRVTGPCCLWADSEASFFILVVWEHDHSSGLCWLNVRLHPHYESRQGFAVRKRKAVHIRWHRFTMQGSGRGGGQGQKPVCVWFFRRRLERVWPSVHHWRSSSSDSVCVWTQREALLTKSSPIDLVECWKCQISNFHSSSEAFFSLSSWEKPQWWPDVLTQDLIFQVFSNDHNCLSFIYFMRRAWSNELLVIKDKTCDSREVRSLVSQNALW